MDERVHNSPSLDINTTILAMPVDQNSPPPVIGRRQRESALQLGPRKKPCNADPLVHHGRHFGRTTHAFCAIKPLITNGMLCIAEASSNDVVEEMSVDEAREHCVFNSLLHMIPNFEQRLMESSEEEIGLIADLIQKGASSARSDDTKSLKAAILDWITPRGQPLNPSLARNVKSDRGFHHERTGALLCPAGLDWSNHETREKLRSGEMIIPGDQWPIFIYHGYNYDPEDPWNGAFQSSILVSAYKHIFTSPSSVDKEPKATRSGNARIHGMTQVTPASIAYVATQARFALTSSPVFSKSDKITDSERFYNSILDLFEDIDEKEEVDQLLVWWNRQVFPNHASAQHAVVKNSALARIKERRVALKALRVENDN